MKHSPKKRRFLSWRSLKSTGGRRNPEHLTGISFKSRHAAIRSWVEVDKKKLSISYIKLNSHTNRCTCNLVNSNFYAINLKVFIQRKYLKWIVSLPSLAFSCLPLDTLYIYGEQVWELPKQQSVRSLLLKTKKLLSNWSPHFMQPIIFHSENFDLISLLWFLYNLVEVYYTFNINTNRLHHRELSCLLNSTVSIIDWY